MIAIVVLGLVNLFCTGILAGEELVIYYGVRTPLASLDERPQTLLRQALIRRLRILVPAIFVPSILLGVAVTVLGGFGPGFGFHVAGVLALLPGLRSRYPEPRRSMRPSSAGIRARCPRTGEQWSTGGSDSPLCVLGRRRLRLFCS